MAEPLYRIHAVAEMVGISENLLRAWERRYQVVSPRRSPSGYRGYSRADVELLRRVTQLTREGMAIGDIAALLPTLRREVKGAATAPATATPATDAGGQLEGWLEAVLSAARALDQAKVEEVFDQAMATLPPLQVMDGLLMPLQLKVGDLWHKGELTTGQEHLVSYAVRARLTAMLQAAPRQSRRHAVCACLATEEHDLGLLSAAVRFRHHGFRVTYLGARTPTEQLVEAVEQLKPDVVALSAVVDPGLAELKRALAKVSAVLPRGARLAVGGPGAERHQAAVDAAGALLVTADSWPKLLR